MVWRRGIAACAAMTEWNAADYARRSELQAAMAAEVLGLLDLKGSERVLDIGCGDGRITAEIAARVLKNPRKTVAVSSAPRDEQRASRVASGRASASFALPSGEVVGVDASHDMIAFATERFDPASHPNLRFEVADARRLPFWEEFDLVISFNALHWVPEQGEALDSVRRAMKPDATAQLRLVPTGERKSLEAVLEETRQSPRWARYFDGFRDPYLRLTQEQYAELAEKHGLRVQRIHTALKQWDFQSRSAFLAFGAVTFVEWTRRLPEDEREAFAIDVLDRYQKVAADSPAEANMFKFYQMDVRLARA